MHDNSPAAAGSQRGANGASSAPIGNNRAAQPSNCVEEFEAHGDLPQARFGHTITVVHKTKVVLFGGATGDTGRYQMTGETYLYNILNKAWQKLEGKQFKSLFLLSVFLKWSLLFNIKYVSLIFHDNS